MSSIPLPALSIKPIDQPDALQNFARIQQLRQMQQEAPLRQQIMQQQAQTGQLELQQKQIELKDQQALTNAMHEWDGKDLNGLVPLVVKNGGSANAVMGLKSKILEQQQTYSKIAADDATTGSKNIETKL